jgi:hypothetical protein
MHSDSIQFIKADADLVLIVVSKEKKKECSQTFEQCCQMTYFRNENSNLGTYFEGHWNGKCWHILLLFSKFYGRLEHFMSIWYILVFFYQENLAILLLSRKETFEPFVQHTLRMKKLVILERVDTFIEFFLERFWQRSPKIVIII